MNIPKGWPTKEMITAGHLELADPMNGVNNATRATAVFKAMLSAAPTPPAHPAPVAWIIDYTCEGHKHRPIFGHNAIADYRDIDPGAVATPLYTSPPSDKLREAAGEVLRCFDSSARYSTGFESACERLRAALEGK